MGLQRMRWLDGITDSIYIYEFEQALGLGDGQGGLECSSPWGHKELEKTEQLNRTELMTKYLAGFLALASCSVVVAVLNTNTHVIGFFFKSICNMYDSL